jgi:ATP-dependent helicase/nuclease subunit A
MSTTRSAPAAAPPDRAARLAAVDPRRNIVLEASAGTGKTSVLVARYLNLLRAGVDPLNVLAITFTRQAAAEMRERIVQELRQDARRSRAGEARWRELRDRLGEIGASTIDAFCLSLLREFPLEADLDPGFAIADETRIPHVVRQAVERTLVAASALAGDDPNVAMLLARLGPWRMRLAVNDLVQRRSTVATALERVLRGVPRDLNAAEACRAAAASLAERLEALGAAPRRLLEDGPVHHGPFAVVARDLAGLDRLAGAGPARIRAVLDRLRAYFLTRSGTPRKRFADPGARGGSPRGRRFRAAAAAVAPVVHEVLRRFDRDVNAALVRGVQRVFRIGVTEYRRELESCALLDFSDVLERAVDLLRRMDEFARSRYRLESRYHHVLVDEFQDTSRAQWELVSLLVQSWGEGSGLVHDAPLPPSVFVVGDRKQSIYRFRDADVSVLEQAGIAVAALRADQPRGVRQWISHSFRAVPALLAFVNDLFAAIDKAPARRDAFRFDEQDRFPVDPAPASGAAADRAPVLGVAVAPDVEQCAALVAGEVARLLDGEQVRDRGTGLRRRAEPRDVAVLFRSRQSHREFERALNGRGIQTCAYKGLGFFDAEEIKDVRALLRYLAEPSAELRAAALLRSRLVGISDLALARLAGRLGDVLLAAEAPAALARLPDDDRRLLALARESVPRWVALVDRLPPAALLDLVLDESAYDAELVRGNPVQARENVKKMRGLVRRVQNRGYATMARVADHIDELSDDVSNAVVDAFDAVNLTTVHAAKGLEFPVVFLVDLGRGAGAAAPPVRVTAETGDGQPSVSVWPFRTEADDDQRLADREESKRLLYVAATRARDRLYFSAMAGGGVCEPSRGSLGEVLPASFVAAISRAAGAAEPVIDWAGADGRTHRFTVVGAGP